MTVRLLVLLATYQGEAFIDQQIASILWQVGVEPHILVRDDKSRDGTLRACATWAERRPDAITIIEDGVRAGGAPQNFFRLLAAAPLDRFDYIAFADQDDVWFPDKLQQAVDRMRTAHADGYSSDLLAYDETARKAWLMDKAGSDADLDYLFQGGSAGCTYVLSTAAAQTVRETMAPLEGAWPHRLSHDWTIYAICRSRGLGWVRDRNPGLLYRQHSANDYGAQPGFGGLLRRLGAVRNAWYRNHVSWLREIVTMTAAEQEVFDAIDRGDRRWLARNARRFRRGRRDARLLAASFLAGLF